MNKKVFDILVIGGGINGVGVARDAAGRGLSVALCEKDDIASHTSSASTKLIHGGLRYLEQYDFLLVRKALIEREVLLQAAPHIIWPLRFVIPLGQGSRPSWLVRLGLFLYDNLGGRRLLPATRALSRKKSQKLDALKRSYTKAYEYSDCWVDDARLAILNAVDAKQRGADIFTRTRCVAIERGDDYWTVSLQPDGGEVFEVQATVVVNAAGPWVDQVANLASSNASNRASVRLVKGSHIIVPKIYDGDHCYFFQNPDGRIFFAIPYLEESRTLIGTTDVPVERDVLDDTTISRQEIEYLCESASTYFEKDILPEHVTATYSGVRPLYDDQSEDASKVTRDYVLKHDDASGAAIVSIFGGKITTYRTLAEHVMQLVARSLPKVGAPWTQSVALPGGEIENADFEAFLTRAYVKYSAFDANFVKRYARLYGTRMDVILKDKQSLDDLGAQFSDQLFEAEVSYLMSHEFAQTAEDVLERRTKLGLGMSEEETSRLRGWMLEKRRETQLV